MGSMVKAAEYREMSPEALEAKVRALESQLFNSRMQAGMGKLENTSVLRTLRKDIARAQTVLAEKAVKANKATKA
jgi:large subunit ribosomal protein L29